MKCRNCEQEGHMSRECPEPRNPATVTCRNCEKVGHFSKDCDQPRDYSKVQCRNCGECESCHFLILSYDADLCRWPHYRSLPGTKEGRGGWWRL